MRVLTLMGLLLWALSAVAQPASRLGYTNIFAYDFRGNVTATTNAVGGITLMGYDELDNKTNEVLFLDGAPYATNRWAYGTNGLVRASLQRPASSPPVRI